MGKTYSTKTNSKKSTSATTPFPKKKLGLISKKKTISHSPAKPAKKAATSAFTKTVTLFRDQKDVFTEDVKYRGW